MSFGPVFKVYSVNNNYVNAYNQATECIICSAEAAFCSAEAAFECHLICLSQFDIPGINFPNYLVFTPPPPLTKLEGYSFGVVRVILRPLTPSRTISPKTYWQI